MRHGYREGRLGWARVLPEGTTRRYQEIIDRIYYAITRRKRRRDG